jgi:thymidylate synthase
MKVLFSCANCSSGVVARASCPCVSIKPTFSETHGRDARATILVAADLGRIYGKQWRDWQMADG